jgi:hypothetical protein
MAGLVQGFKASRLQGFKAFAILNLAGQTPVRSKINGLLQAVITPKWLITHHHKRRTKYMLL